jgi:hypothetical protein|tara:strand:- start:412 stop:636 length:225 start_codon:yes stop_codon:yes gene_type:complete
MSANLDAYTTPRHSVIGRADMNKRIKKIEEELEAIRDDLMQLTTMLFALMPDTDDSFDIEAEVEKEDPLDRWKH